MSPCLHYAQTLKQANERKAGFHDGFGVIAVAGYVLACVVGLPFSFRRPVCKRSP